jgi:hypothetical protein
MSGWDGKISFVKSKIYAIIVIDRCPYGHLPRII